MTFGRDEVEELLLVAVADFYRAQLPLRGDSVDAANELDGSALVLSNAERQSRTRHSLLPDLLWQLLRVQYSLQPRLGGQALVRRGNILNPTRLANLQRPSGHGEDLARLLGLGQAEGAGDGEDGQAVLGC